MGVVIDASMVMRAEAVTQPGGTVPVPHGLASSFNRGVNFTAGAANADALWSSTFTLAAGAAVKVNADAGTYTTTGTATVAGSLAYTKDIAERNCSQDTRNIGIYNATSGASFDAANYGVYVGRYGGAVADWVGDHTTPASGTLARINPGDGLALSAYNSQVTDLIIANDSLYSATIEMVAVGVYS